MRLIIFVGIFICINFLPVWGQDYSVCNEYEFSGTFAYYCTSSDYGCQLTYPFLRQTSTEMSRVRHNRVLNSSHFELIVYDMEYPRCNLDTCNLADFTMNSGFEFIRQIDSALLRSHNECSEHQAMDEPFVFLELRFKAVYVGKSDCEIYRKKFFYKEKYTLVEFAPMNTFVITKIY